jgi:hypothetical protein
MALHVLLLLSLLNPERLHEKVCMDEQASLRLIHYFNSLYPSVSFLLHLLLRLIVLLFRSVNFLSDNFVFLVDIDDVNETLLISCVEFTLLLVPTDTGVAAFIRVLHGNLLGSLSCLKPLQFLVVTDCEY